MKFLKSRKEKRMEETKMEIEDVKLADLEIGEDKPEIGAGQVKVVDTCIEKVISREGKEIGHKLVLKCQHPQVKDRDIEISGVKYLQKEKVKTSGLWLNLDADGKLQYKSAVASMLRFLGVTKITGLKDAQLEAVQDDNGYLVIKAY